MSSGEFSFEVKERLTTSSKWQSKVLMSMRNLCPNYSLDCSIQLIIQMGVLIRAKSHDFGT